MGQWQEDLVAALATGVPIVTPAPILTAEVEPATQVPVYAPDTATLTAIVINNVASVIIPTNANRRRIIIHNDSSGQVFVGYGTTVTPSLFSIRLVANEKYESPLGCYTGIFSAVRASGTSTLLITEISHN